MDRVFSIRMDESLVKKVNRFASERSISKKGLVEKALQAYFNNSDLDLESGILDRSFGAWKRGEKPDQTWSRSRKAFNKGYRRRQKTDQVK